jgi:hypothetical protein
VSKRRDRPQFYPDRLFLKALVIMIVRRLHKVNELLKGRLMNYGQALSSLHHLSRKIKPPRSIM